MRLRGDANGEPKACNGKKKGERCDAKMKVTVMTDAKLKELIARIQRAGIAVTSDELRMVIGKSLEDESKAEGVGQGGADEGDSEGEGEAQRAEIDYLPAESGREEAPDDDSSTVVQCTNQDRSPTGRHQGGGRVQPGHDQQQ